MIHKFVANDNKGNVNILEVTSTGTKLGKVAPPVEDTDAATKKYVDDNTGSSLPSVTSSDNGKVLGVVNGAWAAQGDIVLNASTSGQSSVFAITITSNLPAEADVAACFKSGRGVVLIFSSSWRVRLSPVEFVHDTASNSNWYSFSGIGEDFDRRRTKYRILLQYTDGGTADSFGGGCWDDKYIVTLTPTALDYSGTMDKTVAEINAAYEAGQEIWFKLQTSATAFIEVPVQLVGASTTLAYPSFETSVVMQANNLMIFAKTSITDDGTKQTYSTTIYSLTPAS